MARITLADDWKDFRGRIGDAVIYSWRGIICMRCYVVPHNPDTPAQRIRRQRFAAGVACWKSLPLEVKARWNAMKTGNRPTGYNLFMAEYMRCCEIPVAHAQEMVNTCLMVASSLLHTRSASFQIYRNEAAVRPVQPYKEQKLALSG